MEYELGVDISGSRQHILPRFLLQGFSSTKKVGEYFAWVYRKENNFRTNIINISVEKNFYGSGESGDADELLTKLENQYAPSINALRSEKRSVEIVDSAVVDFVMHMLARTKHFRTSFGGLVDYLIDESLAIFLDPKNVSEMIESNPDLVMDSLSRQMAKLPVNHVARYLDPKKIASLAPQIYRLFREKMEAELRIAIEMIARETPEKIREIHNRVIAENFWDGNDESIYRKLYWGVRVTQDPICIGDVACVCETTGVRRFKPIPTRRGEIRSIYLPISEHMFVVGSVSASEKMVEANLLNRATARLSKEFIVASEDNAYFEELSSLIDTESYLLHPDRLKEISQKALARLLKRD